MYIYNFLLRIGTVISRNIDLSSWNTMCRRVMRREREIGRKHRRRVGEREKSWDK
jgi:hypothetical protein